ncbi:leucine-rich repeat domain-containing protein [Patescibacteria group bacterium]
MKKNIVIVLLIAAIAVLFLYKRNPSNNIVDYPGVAIETTETTDTSEVMEEKRELPEARMRNSLDLSGQGLEKLPASVLSNTSLEELDISDNNLTGALPAEIRHLSNLRVLDASDNKMTGVPAEVGQLSKLEVLDLSNNELTGLPYELGNLKSLKTLDLSGNAYAEQDLEIIKNGLSSSVEIIL